MHVAHKVVVATAAAKFALVEIVDKFVFYLVDVASHRLRHQDGCQCGYGGAKQIGSG